MRADRGDDAFDIVEHFVVPEAHDAITLMF